MIFFNTGKIQKIFLNTIDLEDNFFKLSKSNIDELKRSIFNLGVLEPPVLLCKDNRYIIISGHNRLRVLNELQRECVNSVVLDEITLDLFLEYALLKNYRSEIGPVGKLRAIIILKKFFSLSDEKLNDVASNLSIPDNFLKNKFFENIENIPDIIRDYIDLKNIGFKVIKNLFRLPSEGINIITGWIKVTNMRVNIFKSIVDLSIDIFKRDRTFEYLGRIEIGSIQDRRSKEEYLFNEVFKIRYPEYRALKERVEEITAKLNRNGIYIDFPRYFEGENIVLSLNISKRDGIESFNNKLSNIDTKALGKLIELL